jgi:hypothetical protein
MSPSQTAEDAEPLEQGPAGHFLYVPVRSGPLGCAARFFRTPLGGRTAVAFTTEQRLARTLGPAQQWIRLSEPALRSLAAPLGITTLRIDPRLSAPAAVRAGHSSEPEHAPEPAGMAEPVRAPHPVGGPEPVAVPGAGAGARAGAGPAAVPVPVPLLAAAAAAPAASEPEPAPVRTPGPVRTPAPALTTAPVRPPSPVPLLAAEPASAPDSRAPHHLLIG